MNMVQHYLTNAPLGILGTHPTSRTPPNWQRAMPPQNNGVTGLATADAPYNTAVNNFAQAQLRAFGPTPPALYMQRNFAPGHAPVPGVAMVRTGGLSLHHRTGFVGEAGYFGPGLVRNAIPPVFYLPTG